jgi:toxin FitB
LYLADTNIISVGAPRQTGAAAGLAQWMDEHSDSLYLSVVSVAEIEDGIAKTRREKAHRKAAELAGWLEVLMHLYASRILVFDLSAARIAGALSDTARRHGIAPGFGDVAIAATPARTDNSDEEHAAFRAAWRTCGQPF